MIYFWKFCQRKKDACFLIRNIGTISLYVIYIYVRYPVYI